VIRSTHLRLLLMTAGLAVGPLPFLPSAWASPPPLSDPSAVPSETAKALAAQGVKLFRDHQYEEACTAFSRAYALDPQTETLLELGLAEVEAGHPAEAFAHLNEYLGQSDAPPAKADVVRTKWLPRAESQTARVDVFVRAGAEIRVDGKTAPAAPSAPLENNKAGEPATSIVISAGEHEVSARDGTLVQSQHVVASAGERIAVHFQRIPDARESSNSGIGWMGAQTSDESERTNSKAKWITVIGLGSAAVVATGVAIGFSVATLHSASDANTLMDQVRAQTGGDWGCSPPTLAAQCPQVRVDRQSEHNSATLANGFYGAAAGLAVLGVGSFLFWPSPKGASASFVRPFPLLGDRAAGAGVTGAW